MKQTTKYTVKYSLIQGSYWPVYCAALAFASVYLLSKSFTNTQIGYILALANVIAVFLQPAVASFADTTKRISLKNLTAIMALVGAAMALFIFFLSKNATLLAVFFVLELTLLFTLQPLTNALGMHLINKGIDMNFGLARGIGSISFAVFSYIIGYFVDHYSSDSTVIISFIMFVVLALFTFSFADKKYFEHEKKDASSVSKQTSLGVLAFAMKYKRFMLLLVAIALTFISHTLINNYFIQIIEPIGGNTKDMGTAIGIAAFVELPAMSLFMLLIRKFKCSSILRFSFVFFLIKAIVTLLAPNIWIIYVAQLIQFPSYAFFIPASIYYVNQVICEADHVKGQAFITVAITISGCLSSVVGGTLLDQFGATTMMITGTIASGVGLLLSFLSIEQTQAPR